MKFSDLQTRIPDGHYRVNVAWTALMDQIEHYQEIKPASLDMSPDFQRGHVWTEEQQIAYVEFKLSGGTGSDLIQFNCCGWMGSFKGPFVLVDGLQRLTAVMRFLNDEIPAFGTLFSKFEDQLRYDVDFIFCINNLKTRAEVLRWYLEMNTGGTPHSQEEIDKVRALLEGAK